MMNFFLGTVAGGIIACVATISAARHPDVQARLGLVPQARAVTAAPRAPVPCRTETAAPARPVGDPNMLFSRRRFWFVAP